MQEDFDVNEIATCCKCHEQLSLRKEFYRTYSPLYTNNGYMPICKSCFNRIADDYLVKYGSKQEATKRICMAFDLYYSDDIFSKVEEEEDAWVGKYMKRLSMSQYRKKTFDTSLDEGVKVAGVLYNKKARSLRDKILTEEAMNQASAEDIRKWGYGFKPEDYDEMNRHYALLKAANPRADGNQENYIMDCCRIKMHQLKASREGDMDVFQKMTELYTKNYKNGNLKSAGDSAIAEDFVYGVTVEQIEQYTPAEYYKGKELYRDFDNIGDYFMRMVVRPLKNILLGTKEKDSEYYVKDEEESGGGDDDE